MGVGIVVALLASRCGDLLTLEMIDAPLQGASRRVEKVVEPLQGASLRVEKAVDSLQGASRRVEKAASPLQAPFLCVEKVGAPVRGPFLPETVPSGVFQVTGSRFTHDLATRGNLGSESLS